MSRLPFGMIILIVVSILVYFGLAQRLLDRMRLSDKSALAIIAALIVGSFIDIPIMRGNMQVSVNVGGALVPIGLAFYLLGRAGTGWERGRALLATGATAGIIYFVGGYLMGSGDPQGGRVQVLDPIYVYPLVAGTTAYLLGRSRRAAFVAATLGVLALDVIHWVWLAMTGTPGNVNIGGAGAFDAIVVSGLVAVLLAEVVGESRERLQGGPASKGRDPHLIKNLQGVRSVGNREAEIKEPNGDFEGAGKREEEKEGEDK